MSHDDDTCPHLVRANLLEAKNKKLQTEVDHLMIFCNCTLIPSKQLQADYARLKAEVERLTKAGNQSIAVGTKLREMVGDHHWSLEFDRVRIEWNAAKEGKGQP